MTTLSDTNLIRPEFVAMGTLLAYFNEVSVKLGSTPSKEQSMRLIELFEAVGVLSSNFCDSVSFEAQLAVLRYELAVTCELVLIGKRENESLKKEIETLKSNL